jgi:hypothetical protein
MGEPEVMPWFLLKSVAFFSTDVVTSTELFSDSVESGVLQ